MIHLLDLCNEPVNSIGNSILGIFRERRRNPVPKVCTPAFVAAFRLNAASRNVIKNVVAIAGNPDERSCCGGRGSCRAVARREARPPGNLPLKLMRPIDNWLTAKCNQKKLVSEMYDLDWRGIRSYQLFAALEL